MPLARWISLLALVTTAAGCAAQTTQMEACPPTGCAQEPSPATTPYYRELEKLAVADLACPATQLQYYTVARHVGDAVAGCGKKALYVKLCSEADLWQVDCHPSRAGDWR